MLKIYCVPGLANDKRMFDNLSPLLASQDIHFLEHLDVIDPRESMEAYARRLAMTISEDHDENSIIIGMSLGGIISVELSKVLNFKKVFIISSIKHPSELPLSFKVLRRLPLDRINLPAWLIRKGVKPLTWLLKTTNSSGRRHIKAQLDDACERHISWAQFAAANWSNTLIPDNYVHIHGTRDEIFPASSVKASHYIEGGNHYMIMDRAAEVAHIINQEMNELLPARLLPAGAR